MATKRVPLNRGQHARIGPEAVRLWQLINEIIDAGHDVAEKWEEEGGRHRELLDADRELMSMLGLKPWHYSPIWVSSKGGPQSWEDPERHALAQQLRRALEAAAPANC